VQASSRLVAEVQQRCELSASVQQCQAEQGARAASQQQSGADLLQRCGLSVSMQHVMSCARASSDSRTCTLTMLSSSI
jgi:hypothetical protein